MESRVSTQLDELACTLAALHEVRADLRLDFDRAEAALIAQMQKENKKTLDFGSYSFRLESIPVVSCRSCGHGLEPPPGMADHHPVRIKIKKKELTNA